MTRNNSDFHGVELRHSTKPGQFPNEVRQVITAHKDDEQIGKLTLDGTGTVENINVEEEHQNKGVGTAMWRHAQALFAAGVIPKEPKHSNERTPAGEGWAKAVGGFLPPNTWRP